MITRRVLLFYHVCGFGGLSGTLLATAPALAPPVIAFSVVYLVLLAVFYVAGWLAGMGAYSRRVRWPAAILGAVVLWLTVTTAIGPGPGVFALLLSVVSLWPRRLTPASRRSPTDPVGTASE